MREIKFRAIKQGERKFVYGYFVREGGFDYIVPVSGFNNKIRVVWNTAQQFTGLKDKNGKEIYEGDIVKCRKLDKPADSLKYGLTMALAKNFVVEYRFCGFLPFSGWVDNDDLEWEIIGNIYENPELIK